MINKLELSIIIPFHNSKIIKILNSLNKCVFIEKCEIVLVSDGFNTKFLNLENKEYKKLNLIIINSKKLGKIGKLRNLGIKKSITNFCFFIDSDCLLEKSSIKKILDLIKSNDIIKGKNIFIGLNKISKIDAKLRTERYDSNPNFAYCPNLIISKKTFKEIGLFNEKYFYGGDGEFAKRIEDNKLKVIYCKDIISYHDCTDSFSGIYNKWVNYGIGRYLRYKNDSIKKRIKSLFLPNIFKLKNGFNYNLFVFLCLTGRWVGMIIGFFK